MAAPLELTKAKAFGHFRKRLRERYGINKIRYDEYLSLQAQITNGHKNHFVSRASNTKTWWVVDLGDHRILALYCTNAGGFLTCMPLGFLEGAFNGKKPKMRYLGLTEITANHHKLARLCGFSSKLVDVSPESASVCL